MSSFSKWSRAGGYRWTSAENADRSRSVNNYPKWADVRDDLVARAGGEDQITKARKRNQAVIDGHRARGAQP